MWSPIPTDTSLEADVNALAAQTFERFGDVHLLCNNAGVGSRGLPIAELPLRDFEWVIGVNLFGVIHGLRAFLPHMRANDVGHIVNTASVSGLYYLRRMGPYNATKAAVVALSETLKFELDAEGSNVGVSVLCPAGCARTSRPSDRNRPERFAYELDTEQMAQLHEYKAKRREQRETIAIDPSAGRRPGLRGGEGEPLLRAHPSRERSCVRRASGSDRRRREPDRAASVSAHSHDRDRPRRSAAALTAYSAYGG